jgi:hypothetical protein
MNRLLLLPLLLSSVFAFAHEGGHEPRFEEVTRERGVVAPVVLASEAALGPKAAEVYTAELVRAGDGGVKVLLYAADLGRLSAKAKGVVLTVKEGKTTKASFGLTLDRGLSAYVGKAPQAASKPYTIEVSFSEGKRKLASAFINLD